MPADLHLHSNMSDGTFSPEAVVELAKKVGLKTIALTDHDNVDGLAAAQRKGEVLAVEVIPGVEFTTETTGSEIHILGYFFDPENTALQEKLGEIQQGRVERIYKIADRLKELGVGISAEEVLAIAGPKSPGRPHVARVLVARGIVENFKEAFNRYLDNRGPAYVEHYRLTPEEAIKLIRQAGGVAVFAHPAVSNRDEMIPGLMAEGLRGLEVYYSGHRPDQTQKYLGLAKKYGLLMTGGSDYHGEGSGREIKLGDLTIPDELVEQLRDEHLRGN